MLAARGIALAEVEAELAGRTRQSGLQEKASRKGGPEAGSGRPAQNQDRGPGKPKAREQGRDGKGA